MTLPIYVVDAFARRPFTGNPAGVCPLTEPLPDVLMQSIAFEMNHAETAFVWPEGDLFRLRWFTPTTEVDLCGHATLASAHVLFETQKIPREEQARFITRSGILTAETNGQEIQLDFPSEPANASAPATAEQLEAILGTKVHHAAANRMDILVEVSGEETVRALRPNLEKLSELPVRGVIVTARSDSDSQDFVSRFFAPQVGAPEDHVTGSAHCCLAPYWGAKLGKTVMTGYQASPRGGYVSVELLGDRVLLRGTAVTILTGILSV